jgi:hypothetical protein
MSLWPKNSHIFGLDLKKFGFIVSKWIQGVTMYFWPFLLMKEATLTVLFHSSTVSVCGSFARRSHPVLGGTEGEIPSAYSTLEITLSISS